MKLRSEIRRVAGKTALAALLIGAALMLPGATFADKAKPGAPSNTYTVTNTNNSGNGSLRKAISDANANPGFDTINFAIGSGPQTIAPLGSLPVIVDPVNINATTQPGYAGTPIIELSGQNTSGATDGLIISGPGGGGTTIQGLAINLFPRFGIFINVVGGNVIRNCYIGTDRTGVADVGNANNGIHILNSPNNLIGGINAGDRNLISGNNADGIHIEGSGSQTNRIEGNIIGLNAGGTFKVGNDFNGITITDNGSNNTIGNTAVGGRNIISANGHAGIYIYSGASGNRIIKNFIGLDITGTSGVANGRDEIKSVNAPLTVIGQNGAGNFISGNGDNGIEATNASTTTIQFNLIGLDYLGSTAVPNSTDGIHISNSTGVVIGGVWGTTGNLVSGNYRHGIYLQGNLPGLQVKGNLIGTDAGGSQARGNHNSGVYVESYDLTIGGSASADRNIIAGNSTAGIDLAVNTNHVRIFGNYIGTNITGTAALPNYYGVLVDRVGYNYIGGANPGEGNVISGNSSDGISMRFGARNNVVLGNIIGLNAAGTAAIGNELCGHLYNGCRHTKHLLQRDRQRHPRRAQRHLG